VLIWADSKKNIFEQLSVLAFILPILMGLSAVSYLLRYFRWHWLLSRVNYSVPLWSGLLAYIAGFAFTATPGKIGELVRIRYLAPLGVPHHRVISAFVFERTFDLVVVLLIASLAFAQFGIFLFVAGFVALVITVVIILAKNPRWIRLIVVFFRLRRLSRLAKFTRVLREGLVGTKAWGNSLDIGVSLVFGLLAWGLISMAFILLLVHLGVVVPFTTAIAIYPLSMLAGAASMLPGGVGSTEAAIVVMLSFFNASIGMVILAAVGIRIATLWFAILCGLIAMAMMEHKLSRRYAN